MNIIYIGTVVPENNVHKATGISQAGNQMQLNVLRELNSKKDVVVNAISFYPLKVFPKDRRIRIRKEKEILFDDLILRQVGYINLPILKQITQCINVYRESIKSVNEDSIIFSFNLYPQIGIPVTKIMKKKGIKAVTLLADLPIDDSGKRGCFSFMLAKIFFKITKKNIQKVKNYIVLNKNAITEFCPHANYIVVDGAYNCTEIYQQRKSWKAEKNIVYTGSLTGYSGILTLVEAMEYISDIKLKLEIYGVGELKNIIEEKCKNDSRIKYYGNVSRTEILKVQSEAWLLINPRPVDDFIARVTFPSKIFEYMASGTPVLSTRLNGFSDEYEDILFWIEHDDKLGIAAAINDLASIDESIMRDKAERAAKFVRNSRSWERQGEKIYNFLFDLR